MSKIILGLLIMGMIKASVLVSYADSGGQVFYRGGYAFLSNSRGTQVFTDTNAAGGANDSKAGWDVGAGVDLALARKLGPGDLLGEILVDYAHYSSKTVLQTTSALLGGKATSNVTVSELEVVIAPKFRLEEIADGKVRPWIIPAGLAFLVNSPPSNDSNYLDIGYHAGLGVEYMLMSAVSLGVDFRYTAAANQPGTRASGGTAGGYLGINF